MPTVTRRTFVRSVSVGAALVASGATWASTENVFVTTRQGRLRGRRDAAVCVFKGIPYARSPTGKFRFRAPATLEPWAGTRDALECGAPCLQNNRDPIMWIDPVPGSENCLYLNIWTPAVDPHARKPVIVWFHGGGYTSGSGGLPIYDGGTLAQRADVVVVTVNHRLNIFGYLWLGDVLPAYADDGNPGQRDLVESLRWVRANIARFGGHPGNVTIYGESGGGGKVSSLLASPAARKLFHKAIVGSGSQSFVSTREEATAFTLEVLKALNLTRRNAAKLLTESPDRLLEASNVVDRMKGVLGFQPVVDGDFMLHQPWSSLASGESVDIPMIIGTTTDEAAAFLPDMREPLVNDDVIRSRLKASVLSSPLSDQQFGDVLATYRKVLPGATRLELAVAIATDLIMWNSAIHQTERKVAQKGPAVFMYEFAWKTPCFGGMWAVHGIDLPFVFGNLVYGTAWDGTDSDALRAAADPGNQRSVLADQIMAAWGAFAHTGKPTTASVSWPAYDLEKRATLKWGPSTQVVDDPNRDRRIMIHELPLAW
jgi:para-nitrobenzyl esterase